eukprot:273724-Pelagomonas_calceolata.AAC.2
MQGESEWLTCPPICLSNSRLSLATSRAESAEERMIREEAIENWRIAVAFWEVHTARRCLRQWAAHRYLVMESAMRYWQGANLRDSFNHWRKRVQTRPQCARITGELLHGAGGHAPEDLWRPQPRPQRTKDTDEVLGRMAQVFGLLAQQGAGRVQGGIFLAGQEPAGELPLLAACIRKDQHC